jgi:type II secretory pathway pseudopilin PulG
MPISSRRKRNSRTPTPRDGMTLVELLVVALILLLITAVVIPVTAPALAGRRVREAARMVDVFVNGARNRAQQTRRPYGVMIERFPNASNMSLALSYVEVPPAYTGDLTISKLLFMGNGTFGAVDPTSLNPYPNNADPNSSMYQFGDVGWIGTVSPGDILQTNNTNGIQYRLYAGEPYIDANNNGVWDSPTTTGLLAEPFFDCNLNGICDPQDPNYIDPVTGFFRVSPVTNLPPPGGSTAWTMMFADPVLANGTMSPIGGQIVANPLGNPLLLPGTGISVEATSGVPATANGFGPFQIIRRPIKSAATEMQLPDGTAIDLGGFGLTTPPNVLGLSAAAQSQYIVAGSGLDIAPNFATFRPNPNLPLGTPNAINPPDATPVIITFATNGLVDKVYSWDERNFAMWQGRQPTGPIYLLVTRRELIGGDLSVPSASSAKPQYGIQDINSIWVSINPQTGLVVSSANAPVSFNLSYSLQSYEARQNARQAQALGGR